MRMRRLALALVVMLLALAGCSAPSLDQLIPKAEADTGRQVFTHLQRREFAEVEAMLSPRLTAGGPARPCRVDR